MTTFFKANYAEVTEEIKQLVEAFRKLPPTIAKKYMKQGMRRAIKPFLPEVQRNTPQRSGDLVRSAISIVRFYNKADHGAVCGVIGFSRKKTRRRHGDFVVTGAGFHSHLVERGSGPRRKRNGANCGTMPAYEMVKKTLSSQKGLILLAIEQDLARSLEKAAASLRKGN